MAQENPESTDSAVAEQSTGRARGRKKVRTPEQRTARRRAVRRTLLTGLAFVAGFVVLGIAAILVWDYSNSVSFCTNACHDVHPEEAESFRDSYHAEVKCTECHMGRLGTLQSIALKAGHYRHLPEVIFDRYERPLRSETMRPANESCEKCHWPPAFHGDRVLDITRYQMGEENTQEDTYLILKTGGGSRERGLGYGIHWHIQNPVEYIASDEGKQEIRWVRTVLPGGRIVEYNDVTSRLTPEEVASAEKHTMDCVDCHNRVGHPFPSPEDLVDQALSEGRLSVELPYVKAEMLRLLTAEYTSREQALEAVGRVKERYSATYPEVAVSHAAEIEQAAQVAKDLVRRLVFEEPGVTWREFYDNAQHKDSSGCFRCHDGQHLSAEGESIRLHCNICHNVPETVSAGDRPPQVPLAYIQEPPSHLATNFVADHRFQADASCADCHGETRFGSDDSSFCSNSSCHGQAWPAVNLDAAFPHPILLEGRHAQALCSECHQGEREPEFQCANCHQPPQATHFPGQCDECHTPEGFDKASQADFTHPVALEGAHVALQCTACHSGGQELAYECANCHEPPRATHFGPDCEACHTPDGFKGATLPPELHPVPLVGAHVRATCDVCHAEGARVPEYVCTNCHIPPKSHFDAPCDTCHSPEGWVESASRIVQAAPQIAHDLEGRTDCFLCHDPEGKIKPAPANHKAFSAEQCTLCHRPED